MVLLVAGAILGAIASVVAAVFFTETIEDLATRAFGPFARSVDGRRLKGSWISYYEVHRKEEKPPAPKAPLLDRNLSEIEFRRFGRTVVGGNNSGPRRYSLRLKLRDNAILTGTWKELSTAEPYQRYHFGGVQFVWSFDGRSIVGRFVGRDRNNHVNHGYWILVIDEDDLRPIVDEFRREVV